jgi:Fe-S-cluster containining protein
MLHPAFFFYSHFFPIGKQKTVMEEEGKQFPEGMEPIGNKEFQFACHPAVACFTRCCKGVDMMLYPYDIIRLKSALQIDSEELIRRYTYLTRDHNPLFPTVRLKLTEKEQKVCPFLTANGCTVYKDRPSACRMYPLERAVDRDVVRGQPAEYYFLTHHEYCLGHLENKVQTVQQWVRTQQLIEYNAMNDLWTEMDTLFRSNPWKGEGAAGEKQQLAFMVCYNIDGFRRFANAQQLLKRYRLAKDERRRIEREDGELLKFGFGWLKLILTGKSTLAPR